jgi:hypothetical protein
MLVRETVTQQRLFYIYFLFIPPPLTSNGYMCHSIYIYSLPLLSNGCFYIYLFIQPPLPSNGYMCHNIYIYSLPLLSNGCFIYIFLFIPPPFPHIIS